MPLTAGSIAIIALNADTSPGVPPGKPFAFVALNSVSTATRARAAA